MTEKPMHIPPAWKQIDPARLHGTLLVIGAPDVGKSTFARYLYRQLCTVSPAVAYLDGDPGQSHLGPPATMTLALGTCGDSALPPQGRPWRWFVGSVSPRGHMLAIVVGAARLIQAGQAAGAHAVVYDTSGLVDPAQGGHYLKLAQVDLLRPTAVFAIQRAEELEPLLIPLRRSRRVEVIDLRPSPALQPRDQTSRQAHRAARFARYFADARRFTVQWTRLAVLPTPAFALHRLVALEDVEGFTLGLAIVEAVDRQARQVTLYTPLSSLEGVDAVRLGDILLDPQTFRDRPVKREA